MMQKKGEAMKSCFFPSGKIMTYNLTGKFMAPSDTWQHARFDLTDFEIGLPQSHWLWTVG